MMCPTFLFVIFGEMRISMISKNQESLINQSNPCKILFAEHIIFGFAECIIPRFDVFANRTGDLFTERLRLVTRRSRSFFAAFVSGYSRNAV